MKVVALPTSKKQANEEAVEILKDFLARAEAGELIEVAIAGVNADNSTQTASSKSDHFHLLTGAIAMLQFRRLQEVT